MRSVYTDYKELFHKYKGIIEPLSNSLKGQAEFFYSQSISGYAISDISYPPNEILIDDIVMNTISDLDRIKAFHPVERPTRYKYAAYIGFWWQREKPFLCKLHDYTEYPSIGDEMLDSLYLHLCTSVNELFITDVMLSFIKIEPADVVCNDYDKTFKYIDIADSLHYFLKYRHYSAQELELFLKGLNTCPLGN